MKHAITPIIISLIRLINLRTERVVSQIVFEASVRTIRAIMTSNIKYGFEPAMQPQHLNQRMT